MKLLQILPGDEDSPTEAEYEFQAGDTPESVALELLDRADGWPMICSYNGIMREDLRPGTVFYMPKYE